jgi:hypothetical protein
MKKLIIGIVVLVMSACGSTQVKTEQTTTTEAEVLGDEVTLILLVRDTAIEGPDNDRRSYYRIFIDKVEVGRTEIALESQNKKFETTVDRNSHLVEVEKYVLDPKLGRYVKLNNIEQPKPNYFYFDSSRVNRQQIQMEHNVQTNKAEYKLR